MHIVIAEHYLISGTVCACYAYGTFQSPMIGDRIQHEAALASGPVHSEILVNSIKPRPLTNIQMNEKC